MNISVVIPNYNGERILEKNLLSVLTILSKYHGGERELIIIDDASKDTSSSIIKRILDEFSDKTVHTFLIQNDRNLGFAPTVNKGVRTSQGEIVILLNTDVSPENNFLDPLLSHFVDDTVFAVGCLERSIEGDDIHLYGRGLGEWKDGFLVHRAGDVKGKSTLWVSCGSGAFRKSIWDSLGGLNEIYAPFYWEDIDLSYRALKCGYTILFDPKSVVTHRHEEGSIKKTQKSSYVRSIATRNQFLFVWNNITEIGLGWKHATSLPRHLARACKHFDIVFIRGFIQACIRIPKVYTYRTHMIKKFQKSDNQVIAEVNKQ